MKHFVSTLKVLFLVAAVAAHFIIYSDLPDLAKTWLAYFGSLAVVLAALALLAPDADDAK